jgi:LmbE family N-acetylglucosaminyl deacetylase
MNTKKAFAIGCHPDDIEFMMAGTLLLLQKAGYETHYMNLANGCCGTNCLPKDEIIKIRRQEGINAATYGKAIFHESLVDDLDVFYERDTLHRLGAVIRSVNPDIILTHMPNEYMEDHSNTCRLVVTAAFCRGMVNFPVKPPVETVDKTVTVYHSLPYGLKDPFGRKVVPGIFVNTEPVIDEKVNMLSMHKSQKEWLDVSQGQDSYLHTLREMGKQVGQMSGTFEYAEGWIRHLPLGFCNPGDDPLVHDLGNNAFVNQDFEAHNH